MKNGIRLKAPGLQPEVIDEIILHKCFREKTYFIKGTLSSRRDTAFGSKVCMLKVKSNNS